MSFSVLLPQQVGPKQKVDGSEMEILSSLPLIPKWPYFGPLAKMKISCTSIKATMDLASVEKLAGSDLELHRTWKL